jgi:hypothetical protein
MTRRIALPNNPTQRELVTLSLLLSNTNRPKE